MVKKLNFCILRPKSLLLVDRGVSHMPCHLIVLSGGEPFESKCYDGQGLVVDGYDQPFYDPH